MKLFPAIDLRDGNCVRLYQGNYDRETVYSHSPVDQAVAFRAEGAETIHVVDLDAARTGEPTNRDVIGAICAAVDVPVQVGGGVRTEAMAKALFERGVARVVIGTAALENPDLVAKLAGAGHAVAVGLDAYGDEVATHGWTKRTGVRVGEMAARFAQSGAEALVVTEISRDGTLEGPDVDGLGALLASTDLAVVASGGVGSLADIDALSAVSVPGGHDPDPVRRLAGVIVGRALYEGSFTVAQALARLVGPDGERRSQ